jgi:hypothetical protein
VLLPADRVCVRARVRELVLLDREDELGPGTEVERDRPFVLEPAVPGDGLVEELVDPGRRLAEQEAPVPSRRARAEAAPVDDQDALARLCEETRRRAAGNAGSDDDDVCGA